MVRTVRPKASETPRSPIPTWERRGKHRATATAEHEPECTDELRHQSFRHGHTYLRVAGLATAPLPSVSRVGTVRDSVSERQAQVRTRSCCLEDAGEEVNHAGGRDGVLSGHDAAAHDHVWESGRGAPFQIPSRASTRAEGDRQAPKNPSFASSASVAPVTVAPLEQPGAVGLAYIQEAGTDRAIAAMAPPPSACARCARAGSCSPTDPRAHRGLRAR